MAKKYVKLLIDVDDVLIDTLGSWVDTLNFRHNLSVKMSDIGTWDVAPFFQTLKPEEVYSPLYEPDFWRYVKPKPGAVEYISRLVSEGYIIKLVTATDFRIAGFKFENAIYPHFKIITPRDIIISFDKGDVKGDLIVDDCFRNVVAVDSHCDRLLFDAPHNSSINECAFGITRVRNWEEIYTYIDNKFGVK